MKKLSLYGALVIIGTLGLSASAAAKDHDKDNGRHREVREVRHNDRDHDQDRFKHESRAHERHEFARNEHARDVKHERERHAQDRQWAHYRDRDGKHEGQREGWERGKHNPHDHDASLKQPAAPAPTTAATRPARTTHSTYAHHPIRKPVHTDTAAQGR